MVSVRRVAPVLLLVAAFSAFAATPKSSSTPPRELHRVGTHYTAYNPPDPATYPANAKTHTIKSGDTLWALAQQYYGNAYLWPQLWEANTWITDAHWIYPGDVLLVQGEGGAQAGTTTGGTAGTAGTGSSTLGGGEGLTQPSADQGTGLGIAQMGPAQHPPVALGTESDIYCYGYIGDPNEPLPNYFESHEDTEIMYEPRATFDRGASVATGEEIYIHGGTSTGIVPGETYIFVEPGDLVTSPDTKAVIGRLYSYVGQARILCADENRARAIVTTSCREINPGTPLKPLPQLPIPIARVPEMPQWCDEPSNRITGFIVDSREWRLGLAEGNLVQVNVGSADSVQPGDFLTVYRDPERPGQGRQVLGEIGVLTTEAHTATGKIVSMRRVMQIGDKVEAR